MSDQAASASDLQSPTLTAAYGVLIVLDEANFSDLVIYRTGVLGSCQTARFSEGGTGRAEPLGGAGHGGTINIAQERMEAYPHDVNGVVHGGVSISVSLFRKLVYSCYTGSEPCFS